MVFKRPVRRNLTPDVIEQEETASSLKRPVNAIGQRAGLLIRKLQVRVLHGAPSGLHFP